MKKNKLLVPILAVAGLGTCIAPLVVMTSCNNNVETTIVMDRSKHFTAEWGWDIPVSGVKQGTCKCDFDYVAKDFGKSRIYIAFENSDGDYINCITSIECKMGDETLSFTNKDESETYPVWGLTGESESKFDYTKNCHFNINISVNSSVSSAVKLIISDDA